MRILIKVAIAVITFVLASCCCQIKVRAQAAESYDAYEDELNRLDLGQMDRAVQDTGGILGNQSFTDTALKAIKGELDLSLPALAAELASSLFAEVKVFLALLRDITLIAILSAVFKALSGGLKSKSVSELGFYVNYIIIISLLLSSFTGCIAIMRDFVETLCRLIEAAAPVMVGLLALSGNPASAYIFNPIVLAAVSATEVILRDIAAPLLIFAAVLEIVGNLSEKGILSHFTELIKKGLSAGLKVLAGLFAAVIAIQRISVPIADNAAVKTAKFAASAVPVVGQALTGAVDAALYWTGAVKNGVLVAAILAVVVVCLPVLIKLAAFVIGYKATAALIQPISDQRVAAAINNAGGLASIALGACGLAAVMFIFWMMMLVTM